MSLTAAQVGSIAFREPAEGAPGYHDADVDAFMAGIAEEMQRLETENQALTVLLQHSDLSDRLRRMAQECLQAEDRAEALRVELGKARAESPAAAEDTAPRLLELAQQTAEDHLTEARQVAEELLYKASVEAARVTSDAELRACTVVSDARHAHAERIAGLVTKRSEALARIEVLSHEVEERRAALISELGDRLRGMDPKPAPR